MNKTYRVLLTDEDILLIRRSIQFVHLETLERGHPISARLESALALSNRLPGKDEFNAQKAKSKATDNQEAPANRSTKRSAGSRPIPSPARPLSDGGTSPGSVRKTKAPRSLATREHPKQGLLW